MQKLINFMAVTSFLVSTAIVAGGSYVYLNRESLIDNAKDKAVEEISEAIVEVLPSLLGGFGMGSDLSESVPSADVPGIDPSGLPGF